MNEFRTRKLDEGSARESLWIHRVQEHLESLYKRKQDIERQLTLADREDHAKLYLCLKQIDGIITDLLLTISS